MILLDPFPVGFHRLIIKTRPNPASLHLRGTSGFDGSQICFLIENLDLGLAYRHHTLPLPSSLALNLALLIHNSYFFSSLLSHFLSFTCLYLSPLRPNVFSPLFL